MPALLFELGADGGGAPAAALGVALDFGVDILLGRGDMLAPRHLVERQRPAHGLGRRFTLLLAELFPVDVHLHRIDLLIHQAAHEIFHAPVDLAIEERGGDLERDPRGELLQ